MPIDDETVYQLDRLRESFPLNAPDLWAAFQPPASEHDLDRLKRTLDPWVLPDSIETWLRFADGAWSVRFPIVESSFQPASVMAELYSAGLDFAPPGLLPISFDSHVQASIELQQSRPQAIFDTTVDQPEYSLVAPSFPVMLSAIVDLADEGYLRKSYPPRDMDWNDLPSVEARMSLIEDRWRASLASGDWSTAPFAPYQAIDPRGDTTHAGWGPMPPL